MSSSENDTTKNSAAPVPTTGTQYYGGIDPMLLAGLAGAHQKEDIQLRKHFELIHRYRLMVFVFGFLGLAIAAYTNYKVVPSYRTTATVSVGTYVPPLEGPTARALQRNTTNRYYFKNQTSLLKSNAIARNVLSKNNDVRKILGLDPINVQTRDNQSGLNIDSVEPENTGFEIPVDKIEEYLNMISYNSILETTLVKITAYASTPENAAIIANGHAKGFIDIVRQQRLRSAQVNMKYLRSRAILTEKSLRKSQEALRKYSLQHGIVTSENSSNGRYRSLQESLGKANLELATSQAKASEVRKGSDNTITSLKAEHLKLAKLETEYKENKKYWSANSSYIKNLKSEIDILKRVIRTTSEQAVRAAERDKEISRSKERFLREHLERAKTEQLEKDKALAQYNILSEAYKTAKASYKNISRRLDDAIVNAENQQKTVVLVDPALQPIWPNNLRDSTTLWHGLIFGMLVGVGVAYFLNLLDNKIRTVEDVQELLKVPVLGIVPSFKSTQISNELIERYVDSHQPAGHLPLLTSEEDQPQEPGSNPVGGESTNSIEGMPTEQTATASAAGLDEGQIDGANMRSATPNTTVIHQAGQSRSDTGTFELSSETEIIESDLVLLSAPMSSESEAFRTVLTTMSFMNLSKSSNVTLITSSQQGDGKTTVACNLAMAMSELSGTTLLIDADLRLPAVGRNFNQPSRVVGLSDYLMGDVSYYEAVHQNYAGALSILFAGNAVPNPAALLQSDRMGELLDVLRDEYDNIIIDGPPLAVVSDGLHLSRLADGVAVVVRSGKTSKPMAQTALAQLQQVRANVLGTILNGVKHSKNNKYDNYYYYAE